VNAVCCWSVASSGHPLGGRGRCSLRCELAIRLPLQRLVAAQGGRRILVGPRSLW